MSRINVKNGLTALLVILTLAAGLAIAQNPSSAQPILYAGDAAAEKPLRLHILAASDSAFDQSVKLAVRDQVVDYLESVISACDSKEEAMAAINERLPLIEQVCEASLRQSGVSYRASARLETADFPSISYDGVVFAAGDYDALRIVLGEGEGHNWWCVLFPPLCFVDLAAAVDEEAVVAALAEMDGSESDTDTTFGQGYHISWRLSGLFEKH